jgi:hypothetical protein
VYEASILEKINTRFWWRNLKERFHFEVQNVDRGIILKKEVLKE